MLNLLKISPQLFFLYIIAILIALSVHEFAHALAAAWRGDDTARHLGRLTLNPWAHIDGFGALSFLLLGFGWGKPVPVSGQGLKNPKKDFLIIALAGPFSNLILAIISAFLLKGLLIFLPFENLLIIFLTILVTLNLLLMVFNLLPLPPLDGFNLLAYFLPNKYRFQVARYGYWLFVILLVLSIAGDFSIFAWMYKIVEWFFILFNLSII
jgi:Zn-dependent protease